MGERAPAARAATVPALKLRVSAAAESAIRGGHPWLFADSVGEQNRAGECGELAIIYDRKDKFLAIGLYDPDSPLRVRVVHAGKPQRIDRDWWARNLQQALERRAGVADTETNAYRCLNGESDHWPGLVLDRYADTLVLKLYTAAWLPRLEEVIALLREQLQPERLVLRLSRNIQHKARTTCSWDDGTTLQGPPVTGPVTFLETGLRFEAEVVRGQKTGFFLDQRENRRRVEALARGREMLNAFSFSGGFSLYAARGGARSVADLDLSAHALESGGRNFELNRGIPSVAGCRRQAIQAEAFEWLAGNKREQFDLIVVDPPSLAKREAERAGALKAYGRLVSLALEHLRAKGVLVACSCSAHVKAGEFFAAVRDSARASGRQFRELGTAGHAQDHPATFPEAEYLKAIFLEFDAGRGR